MLASSTFPGHWQGDLIVGAGGQSAIAMLVERSSRYLVLGHLGAERTAEVVRYSLIAAVTELPATLHRTVTRDQDAEIAEHCSFPMTTDMRVYFADPDAPRKRGRR
ncbi:IS30 family transposase [Nocardia fluminea]|uniref:IS30 family transposase n=1 Tax=Nocardia TaxID=1817 RepID=UPI001430FCA9|nr:IS30 family transposase [Nocardia mangyaensis]